MNALNGKQGGVFHHPTIHRWQTHGLYPTGCAIPGNTTFTIDNLIRVKTPQLTNKGYGYQIASGYTNTFFSDFTQAQNYVEVYTTPPYTIITNEVPITFSAWQRARNAYNTMPPLTNLCPNPGSNQAHR